MRWVAFAAAGVGFAVTAWVLAATTASWSLWTEGRIRRRRYIGALLVLASACECAAVVAGVLRW